MAFSKARKTCPAELHTLRESCGPQSEVKGEDNNNDGNVSVHSVKYVSLRHKNLHPQWDRKRKIFSKNTTLF